jgi:hypothetical protein
VRWVLTLAPSIPTRGGIRCLWSGNHQGLRIIDSLQLGRPSADSCESRIPGWARRQRRTIGPRSGRTENSEEGWLFLLQPSAQLAARPSRSNKLFEMGHSPDQPGPQRAGHNIRRRKQSVGQIWSLGQGGIFRGDVHATADSDVCRRFQCPQRAIAESKGGMASIDSGDVIQISRVLGISEFEEIGQWRCQQA